MAQEKPQQPYECVPSGGLHHIHRMNTERPGVILRPVTSVKTRKQGDRIAEALNTAWAEGRAYERKHPE